MPGSSGDNNPPVHDAPDGAPAVAALAATTPVATPRYQPPSVWTHTATSADAGRIDKLLTRQFSNVGRTRVAELFARSAVRIDGRKAKKGDLLVGGECVTLTEMPVGRQHEAPQPDAAAAAQLTVLAEHADFVVIAKPAQMPTLPLRAGELGTAANGLAHLFPECATIGDDLRDGGFVHRLDTGTSGCLIAARTQSAYRTLREAFASSRVEKAYLAVTQGLPAAAECAAPLAQRGDHVVADYAVGLSAYTQFFTLAEHQGHAYVRCAARSGRMHQIRAHLAMCGAPIIGDTRYGGQPVADFEGFFLHAASVSFEYQDEAFVYEAPLPARSLAVLSTLGLSASAAR